MPPLVFTKVDELMNEVKKRCQKCFMPYFNDPQKGENVAITLSDLADTMNAFVNYIPYPDYKEDHGKVVTPLARQADIMAWLDIIKPEPSTVPGEHFYLTDRDFYNSVESQLLREWQQWVDIFVKFDANTDQFIDKTELMKVMAELGSDTSTLDDIFKEADKDKDGKLCLVEFINFFRGDPDDEEDE